MLCKRRGLSRRKRRRLNGVNGTVSMSTDVVYEDRHDSTHAHVRIDDLSFGATSLDVSSYDNGGAYEMHASTAVSVRTTTCANGNSMGCGDTPADTQDFALSHASQLEWGHQTTGAGGSNEETQAVVTMGAPVAVCACVIL